MATSKGAVRDAMVSRIAAAAPSMVAARSQMRPTSGVETRRRQTVSQTVTTVMGIPRSPMSDPRSSGSLVNS